MVVAFARATFSMAPWETKEVRCLPTVMAWLPSTLSSWLPFVVVSRFFCTSSVWFPSTTPTSSISTRSSWSPSTMRLRSFFTSRSSYPRTRWSLSFSVSRSSSFCEWMKTSSSPAASSIRTSLKPLLPRLEALLRVDSVFSSGSAYGVVWVPL